MNKFKKGDKVIRTGGICVAIELRKAYVVDYAGSGWIGLDGLGKRRFPVVHFEKAELGYPNPPHVHAELIKVWADGAEIEIKNLRSSGWTKVPSPSWFEGREYRIKPTKSDKDIKIEALEAKLLEIHAELDELKESE